MNTDNTVKQHASLFDLDGVPKMSQAIPLALQHVVAMIVGCVTPAIIISGAAGIDTADRVLLIQASLVVSALATLLQLFPIGNKNSFHLGAGLPVILGVSFAYVPSMQAIAEQSGIPDMGYHNLRKIPGCHRNPGGYPAECHPSEGYRKS